MLVIPSIDVRGGQVVRLLRGDYAEETVYSDDPVAVVSGFVAAGAERVHIVDLDAARGEPEATSSAGVAAAVAALRTAGVAVQVGGGVRSVGAAARWFELGASLVVIGSLAVRDPGAARGVCEAFPARVLAGLDVRDGEARAQGWTEPGGDPFALLDEWAAWPLAGVVFTAIERDGALQGPALDALSAVCARSAAPVFASGGVTTLDDVAACEAAGATGTIVGRALHEGRFDLRAAVERFASGAAA